MARRIILLWLDAYDPALGDSLMALGRLPALRQLKKDSARFAVDHGTARQTGLGGEHLSTALSPEDAARFGAIHFDPLRYAVWQEGARFAPFAAALQARTVVFDACYFDLERAPAMQGLVNWGAHDPGGDGASRPAGLHEALTERFGRYPSEWIYGLVWNSAQRAAAMGQALARGADMRAEAACWLLGERLPDWDLAIVGVAELHTATEALWHGLDRSHPLNATASAPAAREALVAVYDAVDRLVARVRASFPGAVVAAFTPHGMGANRSDVPSMVLLPELLFRHAIGRPLLRGSAAWQQRSLFRRRPRLPSLEDHVPWPEALRRAYDERLQPGPPIATAARDDFAALPEIEPITLGAPCWPESGAVPRTSIDWQPAAWYRGYWPHMAAFALPSFYYGRVRINLHGRESRGLVTPDTYAETADGVERLLGECRDLFTGRSILGAVSRITPEQAQMIGPTEGDVGVFWSKPTIGIVHPRLGQIGPVPFNRTGGHTGGPGALYLAGTGLAPGDYGTADAFDAVPTIVELLGERRPARMSGTSLVPRLKSAVLHENARLASGSASRL